MVITVDTSALVAVLVSEHERQLIVRATTSAELVAPASVPWELGNALSAMLKRGRATLPDVRMALAAYGQIPIRLVDVDLAVALEIAAEQGIYAYDAYLIACALTQRTPLLTLDQGLRRAAAAAGVPLVEID